MDPADDGLIQNLQAFVEKIPFAINLGMRVVEARKGSVKVSVRPQPALFNHFGTYQAGVYFTAAEIAGGLLCGTFLDLQNHLLITQKSSIIFQKATSDPLFVTADLSPEIIDGKVIATLSTQRKTTLAVQVFVKTQGGQAIAECQNDYYLRIGIPKIFTQSVRT